MIGVRRECLCTGWEVSEWEEGGLVGVGGLDDDSWDRLVRSRNWLVDQW